MSPSEVYFETTKEAKLRRIAQLGCTHFIDDLPEFLSEPLFPSCVQRILFDPAGTGSSVPFATVNSWSEVQRLFFAGGFDVPERALREMLSTLNQSGNFLIHRVHGGGNNRVYHIDAAGRSYLLKQYFRREKDSRDRLGTEFEFSKFCWECGVRSVPQPLALDAAEGVVLYEFIEGEATTTVAQEDLCAAIEFYRAINHWRELAKGRIGCAAEACFSLAEHADCIRRRVQALTSIKEDSDAQRTAAELARSEIEPAWQRRLAASRQRARDLNVEWEQPLPVEERRLSPSDFGFHNSLRRADGTLVFIDFEYAGWDDPAKLVCDFFLQPAIPVPEKYRDKFTRAISSDLPDAEAFMQRLNIIRPLYDVKWLCIMLNEFLPAGSARRRFASSADVHARQQEQIHKVRCRLATI